MALITARFCVEFKDSLYGLVSLLGGRFPRQETIRHRRPQHRDLKRHEFYSGDHRCVAGCDVLIHEASRLEWLTKRPDLQPYAAKYHTNTRQLAELASKGKPRLLIIYHASIVLRPALRPQASSPEELLTRSALRVQQASGYWAGSR